MPRNRRKTYATAFLMNVAFPIFAIFLCRLCGYDSSMVLDLWLQVHERLYGSDKVKRAAAWCSQGRDFCATQRQARGQEHFLLGSHAPVMKSIKELNTRVPFTTLSTFRGPFAILAWQGCYHVVSPHGSTTRPHLDIRRFPCQRLHLCRRRRRLARGWRRHDYS